MTNEQLAMLLRHIAARLEAAADETEANLDGLLPRPVDRVHAADECNGLFCQDPTHYVEQPNPRAGRDVLAPIYAMLATLEDDAERLHPQP